MACLGNCYISYRSHVRCCEQDGEALWHLKTMSRLGRPRGGRGGTRPRGLCDLSQFWSFRAGDT